MGRARFSQRYSIGLGPFMGWLGTSMPLTDKTTSVVFPHFEASKYTVDQLGESHWAYMDHLKFHFDEKKARYGMRSYKLVFVGNDRQDDDILHHTLTKVGLLKANP